MNNVKQETYFSDILVITSKMNRTKSYRMLHVSILIYLLRFLRVEGYKVRACTGQEARLSCSSGWYIVDTSAVGGFGPSGTPCTATASCMTNSVRGSLTEVNGNLAAFASNRCNNKQTCNFLIDSNWQSAASYCDSHVYSIIYVDVEYNCYPLTMTPVTTTTTTVRTETTTKRTLTVTKPRAGDVSSKDTTSTESEQSNMDWVYYVIGIMAGVIVCLTTVIIVMAVTRTTSEAGRTNADSHIIYSHDHPPNQNMTTSCNVSQSGDADSGYCHLEFHR